MKRKLHIGIAAAVLTVAFGGTAMAQYPQGAKTGTQPQTSDALVTILIPAVVGIDVEHNFVLRPNAAGSGCWGIGAAFPMAPGAGNTTFTFAVNTTSIADTADVACPGAGGGQADKATVKVLSTAAGTSTLKAQIADGGSGTSPGTALSSLVPDIFSKLSLIDSGDGDTCGGGGATKAFPVSLAAAATNYNLVTLIPTTPWSNCRQKLQLIMNTDTVAYLAGVATGKLTYTISTP